MSNRKVYTDYFFDEPAYNTHDGGFIPLERLKFLKKRSQFQNH